MYFELKTGTISGSKTKLMFPVIHNFFFLFQNFFSKKFQRSFLVISNCVVTKVTGHQKIRDFKGLTLGMDLGVVVWCGEIIWRKIITLTNSLIFRIVTTFNNDKF